MRFRVGWILKNSTQWIHIQAGLELCSGVKILLNADRRGKIGGYHAERVHQGHVRACNDSVTVLSEISPLLYTAATAMILNLCFKIYFTTVPGTDDSFGVGDCDDCFDDDDRCCRPINSQIFKDQLQVKS